MQKNVTESIGICKKHKIPTNNMFLFSILLEITIIRMFKYKIKKK
jgi:hypothetical protein